jgi:thiaminase/transcriptional activator TenA
VESGRPCSGKAIRAEGQAIGKMASTNLTTLILERTRPVWNDVIEHRFFNEVATDTIDSEYFVRYLAVEYSFIDTAAIALGHAITKAPSFKERQKLSHGLYSLVTDQETFFQNAFRAFDVPESSRTLRNALANSLHQLFLQTASQCSYAEILATIFGAEWLYLQWCSNANRTPSARTVIREWVALHSGGSFEEHVKWVRSQLDSIGSALNDVEISRLQHLFENTLNAESAFHDAVYQSAGTED